MSMEGDRLIETAAAEYSQDGAISTRTFMALTLGGLDANAILEEIEEQFNG